MRLCVYATPALIPPKGLGDAAAVVIDALRMTTVAATAIANGCQGILAAETVDAARAEAAKAGALLGGERQALPVPGFDFSNSPLEYTRRRVEGKRVVMTTSNGTRAIAAASSARRVVLGAFVNRRAVARAVAGAETVALVCAGTLGAFTLEDALAAGCLAEAIAELGADLSLDDMGIAAHRLYAGAKGDLHAALAGTAHYERLRALGLRADLDFCLSLDAVAAAPERGRDGWITGLLQ